MAGYLVGGYRFTGDGDIRTPAQLRDQTADLTDRAPMSFLCLVGGQDGAPEVSVVHRLLRFMDTPAGDEPSGFNDRVLGLLGDILPHQYHPAVEVLTSTAFHLVGNPVRVPTIEVMEGLVAAWEDPNIPLGPFPEEHPETEMVRPRNTQLVPCKYAALVIDRHRVNATRQAYQEIAGAIRADGALERCAADVLLQHKKCYNFNHSFAKTMHSFCRCSSKDAANRVGQWQISECVVKAMLQPMLASLIVTCNSNFIHHIRRQI